MYISTSWIERRSGGHYSQEDELLQPRDPYERDRARIIHAPCFRRLAAKTQLFNLHDNDFLRTRLTHSLEVGQIACGIVRTLQAKYNLEGKTYHNTVSQILPNPHLVLDGKPVSDEFRDLVLSYLPSTSLIEAISLAHDIGHSPFGHSGEIVLNNLMLRHGFFEANAQTLRIVAKLEKHTDGFGLDLTRRCMLGLVKYPVYIDQAQPHISLPVTQATVAASKAKKTLALTQSDPLERLLATRYILGKGIYRDDEDVFEWILEPLSQADKEKFQSTVAVGFDHGEDQGEQPEIRLQKTRYKSFDCSIMELADDIAYSVHDIEDAVKSRKITLADWDEFFQTLPSNVQQAFHDLNRSFFFAPKSAQTVAQHAQLDAAKAAAEASGHASAEAAASSEGQSTGQSTGQLTGQSRAQSSASLAPKQYPTFSESLTDLDFDHQHFISVLFGNSSTQRKQIIGRMVDLFVSHIYVRQQNVFAEPLLDLQAVLPQYLRDVLQALKLFAYRYFIVQQEVRGKNNKGRRIIQLIFRDLLDEPVLLGMNKATKFSRLKSEHEQMRFICDFVSGMTNDAAERFYDEYVA